MKQLFLLRIIVHDTYDFAKRHLVNTAYFSLVRNSFIVRSIWVSPVVTQKRTESFWLCQQSLKQISSVCRNANNSEMFHLTASLCAERSTTLINRVGWMNGNFNIIFNFSWSPFSTPSRCLHIYSPFGCTSTI